MNYLIVVLSKPPVYVVWKTKKSLLGSSRITFLMSTRAKASFVFVLMFSISALFLYANNLQFIFAILGIAANAASPIQSEIPSHANATVVGPPVPVPVPDTWWSQQVDHNGNIGGQKNDDVLGGSFTFAYPLFHFTPYFVQPPNCTIKSLELDLLYDNGQVRAKAAPSAYASAGGSNGIGAIITSNHIGTNNEQITVHFYAGSTQGVHYRVVYHIPDFIPSPTGALINCNPVGLTQH